jgi:hypothetical protein
MYFKYTIGVNFLIPPYMALLSHLFHSMELDLIHGGMSKDNITQPYKIYDDWLSEIEDYIQNVVTGKSPLQLKNRNMNNFSRNDYLVGQLRNDTINLHTTKRQPYLETISREQRLNDIISKKNDSIHTRGKGKWLV